MRRREFFPALAAAGSLASAAAQDKPVNRKGRLKQSVTRGVFGRGMDFEESCKIAARMGCKGYDLIGPKDWPTLKKYNLLPTMFPPPNGGTIPDGLNRKESHARIIQGLREAIDEAAKWGCPNVITFSGNRAGMADAEGADNCVIGLKQIKAHAEDKGVNVCMELLNSKVNHKDYMCDHTVWGVNVVKQVGSPRVGLLYDIYHLQIMEGDIVRTIRENIQWLKHFHTGGNPGRHEIDDSQELNYRFVAQSIAELGFQGYIAHEYSPAQGHDPLQSLETAMQIFDV
jgi:hydroxypyruvate isomerase